MWSLPYAVSVINCNKIYKIWQFLQNEDWERIVKFIHNWSPWLQPFKGQEFTDQVEWSRFQSVKPFQGVKSKLFGFRYSRKMRSWLWGGSPPMFNVMRESGLELHFKMYQRLRSMRWYMSLLYWLSKWMPLSFTVRLLSGIRSWFESYALRSGSKVMLETRFLIGYCPIEFVHLKGSWVKSLKKNYQTSITMTIPFHARQTIRVPNAPSPCQTAKASVVDGSMDLLLYFGIYHTLSLLLVFVDGKNRRSKHLTLVRLMVQNKDMHVPLLDQPIIQMIMANPRTVFMSMYL